MTYSIPLVLIAALLVGFSPVRADESFKILIFNKTAPKAYHDKGIPAATAALQALGPANGFTAEVNSDGAVFTDEGLKPYAVLVFLNTCNDVLNDSQQQAMKHFIEAGGGFVGIHATITTGNHWPWFAGLVGAQLKTDKHFEPGTVHVADATNPATRNLPETFSHKDQWFLFKEPPHDVQVLLTVDGTKLTDLHITDTAYPVAWCHAYDGGRAFFTSFGHESSFDEPAFARQVLGAIQWARTK